MKRATLLNKQEVKMLIISIHALVKRATFQAFALYSIRKISIHALVKRATEMEGQIGEIFEFQSTPS